MKKQLNLEKAERQKIEKIILNSKIELKYRQAELCKISGDETLFLMDIFYKLRKKADYVLLITIMEKNQNERFAYLVACDRRNDYILREVALRKIKKQRWLFRIAVCNDDWRVRKTAISRMNDLVLLMLIKKSSKNCFIAEMSSRRIDEIKKQNAWLKEEGDPLE